MKAIIWAYLLFININLVHSYMRACYFTNWAQYRQGRAKYLPEDYLPGLCTHIFFAFGWMNEDFTAKAYDPADLPNDWAGKGLYNRINALKTIDPALKTLLSFGGWTFGTDLFKRMALTQQNRKIFIDSVVKFVKQNGFDGIDIDWEYPNSEDKSSYIQFLKELREAVIQDSRYSNRNPLLITAAVAADTEKIEQGYDVPAMSNLLDHVLLMSYDFHGSWEQKTGMNAPLYAPKAANFWIKKGLARDKLIIGLPTYGRGWTLSNPTTDRGIGAAGSMAKATQFVQLGGTAAYFEQMVRNVTLITKHKFHILSMATNGLATMMLKAQWVRKNNFGGAFVWTLDFDDFNGKCSTSENVRYPLIRVMTNILGNGNVSYGTTSSNYVVSPTPNGLMQNLDVLCYSQKDGFYSMPNSCNDFVLCLTNQAYSMKCPSNLEYNSILHYCTHPTHSGCSYSKPNAISQVTTTQESTITTKAAEVIETNKKSNTKDFVCTTDGYFADPLSCFHFYRCVGPIAYRFDCPAGLKYNQKIFQCDVPNTVDCE